MHLEFCSVQLQWKARLSSLARYNMSAIGPGNSNILRSQMISWEVLKAIMFDDERRPCFGMLLENDANDRA